MKPLLNFIKTTLIGGLFFLVPFFLIIIILKKIFVVAKSIVLPISSSLPEEGIFGLGMTEIGAIILVIFICFLAGMFGKTRMGKRTVEVIEDTVLEKIPGYTFMKNISTNAVGIEEQSLPVVMVRVDDGWQIAFLVEETNDKLSAVFVPNAPNPWSGGLYYIEKEKIQVVNLSQRDAFTCLKKLGMQSSKILKDKINFTI